MPMIKYRRISCTEKTAVQKIGEIPGPILLKAEGVLYRNSFVASIQTLVFNLYKPVED